MISRILISASAGIILFLGGVHLAYTFLTHKFSPTEKQLETAMKQVAPRISGEATSGRSGSASTSATAWVWCYSA